MATARKKPGATRTQTTRTQTARASKPRESKPDRKGRKRPPRTIEERLRKYQLDAAGYEFIPALMHEFRRILSGDRSGANHDERFLRALQSVKGGREWLLAALDRHEKLPYELKQRIFSPRYLNMAPAQAVGIDEMAAIIARGAKASGLNVNAAAIRIMAARKHDCCCCCDDGGGEGTPPRPQPNAYELSFTRLYCIDESDPEWGWGVHDEPYGVFAVITEAMAEGGTAAIGYHTPVYEEVDDGDTRPGSGDENLRLYGFAGPRALDSNVLVTATCFEHDLGDVSDITDKVRAALTAVATKAAAAGGVVGWIIAAAAVIGIGVSYLVDLIGADDQIGGTRQVSLNQAQADSLTAGSNPYVFPALRFDGGDDDGIYDFYLRLRRA
ncbi:hypothetical protein [Lysobacter solisilvae (ex Woo and Kim 2020)]|uniref:Uncharacterized protein n=1 Tax=Agrilutibacter terrestris TaxID=2865112 RepID=A0A7H0FTM7_9GAMM|nr:hypothetical protein [Lysobacter terrestris]QNP39393.1 hypothetical protein H8B22_07480 [Lysobacter terrestris]